MPLADEFFFVAHDVQTGKLRLQNRAAGLGLAGALLGELVLNGNIDVANGTLTVIDGQPLPEDDLGYRVLRQLNADRQNRSLRTWLAYFSQGAVERVGVRLTRAGHVQATKTRRPWGTVVRYMPSDLNMAVWPADRLNLLVSRGDPLDFPDAMLAGLVAVTGMTKQVWWDGDAVTLRNIAAAVASLPISLREILAHTEAAVGDATLSPHS
ncbi:MAG TPA: GPP34 family phosphoprotein [Jiangellaceae bacterium]|nr:GPP34 family phosphoprotein [Jiangellaceae bacterium]